MEVDEERLALEQVREILAHKREGFTTLISVLQEVQERVGYLPKQGMIEIARHFGTSPARVYGVATFYNQFRFTPPGKHHVKVCLGTACHIKGGDLVMDHWKRRLGIEEGGRTEDGEYSLERVGCVGCCVMAPVSVVSEEVIGQMSPTKVDGILLKYQIAREQKAREREKEAKEAQAALAGENDK